MRQIVSAPPGKTGHLTRAFFLSLAVLVLTSVVNWGLITGWGNVRITQETIVGDDGLRYTALLYVPENATNDTPAPAVLIAHGNAGNARNHESWAVEFARRGFVVLSINHMGGADFEHKDAYRNGSFDAFTNYINGLPIVDRENIAVAGHSAGCSVAYRMAELNGYGTFINADNAMWLTADNFSMEDYYTCNTLILTGTGDRNDTVDKVKKGAANVLTAVGHEFSQVEPGRVYGSFAEKNAVQLAVIDKQVHEGCLVNTDSIAAILDFTQSSISAPNYIAGGSQVWMWKDVAGLASMFAFVVFLMVLASCLLACPFFASIRQPLPRNIGLRGKGLALSIAAALVFPLLCLYTGSFGLVTLLGDKNIPLFPLHSANKAFGIVVGICVLGIVMLGVFQLTDGKKQGATLRDYGLVGEDASSSNLVLIGKCLLLSVAVVGIGFAYLSAQNAVFGTELYCLFFGFKPIPAHNFGRYVPYILVWVLCFLVAALGMNVERRLPSTGDEKKDTIVAVVFNALLSCAVITFLVVLQMVLQRNIGAGGVKPFGSWGGDLTKLWGMPFGMLIAGGGSTYLYRKTGTIWTGAFLMGILCALSCVLYGQFRA